MNRTLHDAALAAHQRKQARLAAEAEETKRHNARADVLHYTWLTIKLLVAAPVVIFLAAKIPTPLAWIIAGAIFLGLVLDVLPEEGRS